MAIVKEEDYVKTIKNRKKINSSVYFLLPLLNLSKYRHLKSFINSYLGVVINDKLTGLKDGYLYLVFNEENDLIFNEYLNKHFSINNVHIYEFILPERFIDDYYKFIDGKYSEFSPESKVLICNVRSIEQKLTIQKTDTFEIFTKSPERIKYLENLIGEKLPNNAEVMSKINIDDEIYEC